MKILFISSIIPEYLEKEYKENKKGSMQTSSILFQNKIIKGLDNISNCTVDLFNILPVDSFPKYYAKPFIKNGRFSHRDGADDYEMSFLNVIGIKQFVFERSFKRQLKKMELTRYDCIVCYSAICAYLLSANIAKKKNSKIKTLLILPDIPKYLDLGEKSLLKNLLFNHRAQKADKRIKNFEKYVFLTRHMAELYGCNDTDRFCIIEGIGNNNLICKEEQPINKKLLLYTGTTNKKFGIKVLLDAFSLIEDPQYRLIICGCGDMDGYIATLSEKDSRIKFMGIVDHIKVVELQKKAGILINPRQNNEEFTKYSFPSKNIEYLESGIPFIGYKLDGIPDEYDDYINYPNDNSAVTLKTLILEIEQHYDLFASKAKRAQNFILNEKNFVVQARKIYDLINRD